MTNKQIKQLIMFANIITPLQNFKIRYIPLLAIYFANSFTAFSKISETYWIKDSLTLTPGEITSITIWANLPWTMKIILGQFLDSVKILGSQRNIYVFIAAFIMMIGFVINIAIANEVEALLSIASIYHLLIISGALVQIGLALQDLVADTLCYDVVEKKNNLGFTRSESDIKIEMGQIQILVKFVDIIAAILAASISGYIATNFNYSVVSYFSLVIVAISIAGIIFFPKEPIVNFEKINPQIIFGGLLYLFAILISSISGVKNNDVIILVSGTLIVSTLIYNICRTCNDIDKNHKANIARILVIIFAFRATPGYSPGIEWWQIDVLKFDANFFSLLDQLSIIFSLLGVWILSKRFVNMDIINSLLILKIIHILFQIPYIGMAFGLHEWTEANLGFGARTIALIDISGEGPFQKLEFMIICYAATLYAPKKNVASWFALCMSLISISYIGAARIIKRLLAESFIIERGWYDNVAQLMIATNAIHILLPILAIILSNIFISKKIN